tara:strand:- start:4545 stop:5450 length:906 start_codon:yes stop_codon:yes gene_type:complete
MKKKTQWFSGLIFFLIIIFLYKTSNQNQLIEIIKNINLKYLIITVLLFIIRSFLINYRWFIIVKNFSKISFIEFYKNLNIGTSLNLITSSSLAVELAKLFRIKKELGTKKSIFLVSLDKVYSLIFKIFFIVFVLNFYNYIYKPNLIMSGVIFSLFFFTISLIVIKNTSKILSYVSTIRFIKINFDKIIELNKIISKSTSKIYLVNFLIQILNIFLYFVIFESLNTNLSFIQLSLFVPLLELIGQFQFFILGLKELSMIYLFQNLDLTQEIVFIAALLYILCESFVITIIFLYFYLIGCIKK